MIAYGVGYTTKKTISIMQIDRDYFEWEVLAQQEIEEARQRGEHIGGMPVSCPKCHRQDYREGWE